jgi:hypothetical protein|tara:strand:- start:166 stop:282 length:117 start_codon:yes stop_codon:yes gene_type:complete
MVQRGKIKDYQCNGNGSITAVFKEEIADIHLNRLVEIF